MKIVHIVLHPEVRLIDTEKQNFNIMGNSSGTVTSDILEETRSESETARFRQALVLEQIADYIEQVILKSLKKEELGFTLKKKNPSSSLSHEGPLIRIFENISAVVIDLADGINNSVRRFVNPRRT